MTNDASRDSRDFEQWLRKNYAGIAKGGWPYERKIMLGAWQAALASRSLADASREELASFMIHKGFATGHGDTHAALLVELGWQIDELRARQPDASKVSEEEQRAIARLKKWATKGYDNAWLIPDARILVALIERLSSTHPSTPKGSDATRPEEGKP